MKSWWRAVAGYPPTWMAIVVLAVVVWAMVSLFELSGLFVAVLVLLTLLAVLGWPLTMSATGTLTRLQFEIPRVEEVDPAEIGALTKDLEALPDRQPAEQLIALQQKRESLIKVLERRLDAGELTYSRYLATSQQVFNSALHNLQEVAVAYESIRTIDEAYIDRRLAELTVEAVEAGGGDQDAMIREQATLEQRRELRTTQRRRISQLLAQNESALTALNRTATALADVPIGKRPEDAEAAMAALEELAERAAKYAT